MLRLCLDNVLCGLQLMTELGNELVNGILEAKAGSSLMKKPLPQGSRYDVMKIKNGYDISATKHTW